jgi:hypothetical protein
MALAPRFILVPWAISRIFGCVAPVRRRRSSARLAVPNMANTPLADWGGVSPSIVALGGRGDPWVIKCLLCEVRLESYHTWIQHYDSKKHKNTARMKGLTPAGIKLDGSDLTTAPGAATSAAPAGVPAAPHRAAAAGAADDDEGPHTATAPHAWTRAASGHCSTAWS